MRLILRLAVCALSFTLAGVAFARVEEETLCFEAPANPPIHLAFKYYLDTDINYQLGAVVRYGPPTRPLISLVFLDDGTSDTTVDWELHWLEIVDGKVGGMYSLLKPKAATIDAAYMKYRDSKTGKLTTFRPSRGINGECRIGDKR